MCTDGYFRDQSEIICVLLKVPMCVLKSNSYCLMVLFIIFTVTAGCHHAALLAEWGRGNDAVNVDTLDDILN